jgi:calcineurin-like phosphoesterase
VTDLGMCGPVHGILGTNRDDVIDRFRFMMPTRFHVAEGEISAMGVIFEVDAFSAKVEGIHRIRF